MDKVLCGASSPYESFWRETGLSAQSSRRLRSAQVRLRAFASRPLKTIHRIVFLTGLRAPIKPCPFINRRTRLLINGQGLCGASSPYESFWRETGLSAQSSRRLRSAQVRLRAFASRPLKTIHRIVFLTGLRAPIKPCPFINRRTRLLINGQGFMRGFEPL